MTEVRNEIGGTVFGDVVQAGHIDQVMIAVPPREAMSGLPLEAANFVGREQVIAEVGLLLDSSGPIVVSGPPGVGKTALALRVANSATRDGRFPGGVLFADLRGYDPVAAQPSELLGMFLRALGLLDDQVPMGQGERETTYRSVLAQRAADAGDVLILLDNASSSTQVRPLLPGVDAHRVLVTSRHKLSDIDGVRPVSLDVLDGDESASLLAMGDPSGERLRREPEAVTELAALCGHLPLALRIAAALLLDDPAQPVSELVSALRDERHRLVELQYGHDLAVRAAFDLSYARLSEPERRLFRLLSLAPGQQVNDLTARALADIELRDTRQLLAALCRAHMLQPAETRHWYRFHDLIRLYATQKAEQEDSPEERDGAVDRMLAALYRFTCECVDDLEGRDASPEAAERRRSAMAWLEVERPALVAAVELAHRSDRHGYTVLLANKVGYYLREARRWADATRVLDHGVASAVERGHLDYEATLRVDLAWVLGLVRRDRESIEHLTRALKIGHELNHRGFEGAVLSQLGNAYRGVGDTAKSIEHFRAALEIARETDDAQQQGSVLVCIGAALEDVNDIDGTLDHYNQALALFHQTGAVTSIATTQRLLAAVYLARLRRYDVAFDLYFEALQTYHDLGEHHDEADIWYMLGLVCQRGGRPEKAQEAWRAATELAKRIKYDKLVEDLDLIISEPDLVEAVFSRMFPATTAHHEGVPTWTPSASR